MAMLLVGQVASVVAAETEVPERTVQEWSQGIPDLPGIRTGRLGELLYDYLTTNLETLSIQSRFFRDTDWLEKQTAADAAILHGVLSDKTVRVLAAIERARPQELPA